jgi:hypothetical protein
MIFIAAGKVSKDIMNPHDSMCKGSGLQKQCMILFVMLSLWREVRGKEGKFSEKLSIAVEICGGIQRTRRCEKVNRFGLDPLPALIAICLSTIPYIHMIISELALPLAMALATLVSSTVPACNRRYVS